MKGGWERGSGGEGHYLFLDMNFPATPSAQRLTLARRPTPPARSFLADHDIPADPVLTPAEAREHPQMQARELVKDGADGLPRLGFPALVDGARPRGAEAMPELGGDTDGIVEEFGLAAGLSARKRRAGGVGRRASVQRWALGVAGKVLSKKK